MNRGRSSHNSGKKNFACSTAWNRDTVLIAVNNRHYTMKCPRRLYTGQEELICCSEAKIKDSKQIISMEDYELKIDQCLQEEGNVHKSVFLIWDNGKTEDQEIEEILAPKAGQIGGPFKITL